MIEQNSDYEDDAASPSKPGVTPIIEESIEESAAKFKLMKD